MQVKQRLQELDCLRGIAAISVVMFHFTMGNPAFYGIFDFGCCGVELFFLISGFVIFLTLKKTKTGREFVVSRFARLYPTYWVCVTITTLAFVLWQLLTKQPFSFPTLRDYLLNLTMIQGYFHVKHIDGVYWTLTLELLFYAFMWILLITNCINKIERIGYSVIFICLIYLFILKPVSLTNYKLIGSYCPLIIYCPLFIAGITFYQIKFEQSTLSKYTLVLLCFLMQIFFYNDTGKISFVSITGYTICLAVYFLTFILYCKNLLAFIVNKVTLYLGKISYSLYLIHGAIAYSILIPMLSNSRYFHIGYGTIIFVILLPGVLLVATLINKYIEVPAMRYIKKKALKRY